MLRFFDMERIQRVFDCAGMLLIGVSDYVMDGRETGPSYILR